MAEWAPELFGDYIWAPAEKWPHVLEEFGDGIPPKPKGKRNRKRILQCHVRVCKGFVETL